MKNVAWNAKLKPGCDRTPGGKRLDTDRNVSAVCARFYVWPQPVEANSFARGQGIQYHQRL